MEVLVISVVKLNCNRTRIERGTREPKGENSDQPGCDVGTSANTWRVARHCHGAPSSHSKPNPRVFRVVAITATARRLPLDKEFLFSSNNLKKKRNGNFGSFQDESKFAILPHLSESGPPFRVGPIEFHSQFRCFVGKNISIVTIEGNTSTSRVLIQQRCNSFYQQKKDNQYCNCKAH